ncbi:unnamed protein product [Mytilus coruscus]|uniref:C2H2-type domain-containing protein n=1 Tax=Mytilus coruscus TaxID=42192 RepID=A0A6J8DJB3_MYTCO|nr:unnamed protein product [Mytilus coruscus]
MRGIGYPVAKEDIPKVEKQNNLIINVFALKDQTNKQTLDPIYVSNKESEKCYVVDLLYIENNGNAHYCLIKDLDSFMCDNNGHKQFTCRNCIQGFQREETLEKHKKICYDYEPCRTIMPEPGKNILEFNNHHFKNRLPFVIYCDFEACNIPMQSCTPDPDKSYTKPISKQEINSYGMYVHSDYPEIYKSQYFHYDGDDVDKPILNKYEEDEFQEATECYICEKEFEETNKVREHDHLSGKYRGAACQSCNTKEGKATKLIPVFFHNGSNYDFHFLIEELMKKEDKYNKVKLLSKNSENYISIDYGSYYEKLRFLDSYRFMLKGLSDVAKSMDDFPILEKEFEESDWLAKYINFNTEQRTKSKSDFEKDLWKLMNNSFYGKTLEDIRGRSEIKLLTDMEEVKKYIKKPNFKDSTIFNDNFVAIENNVTSVKFNKPIYLGQAILDYSKQLMYDFYYNVCKQIVEKKMN